jgi:hypothetical protein
MDLCVVRAVVWPMRNEQGPQPCVGDTGMFQQVWGSARPAHKCPCIHPHVIAGTPRVDTSSIPEQREFGHDGRNVRGHSRLQEKVCFGINIQSNIISQLNAFTCGASFNPRVFTACSIQSLEVLIAVDPTIVRKGFRQGGGIHMISLVFATCR